MSSVNLMTWVVCLTLSRPIAPRSYDNWLAFENRVGWRKNGNWVGYNSLTFDIATSPSGELPAMDLWGVVAYPWVFLSRTKHCEV
ncbi:hypothetical protein E1H13_12685 [Nodosilinea sp. P-1105]|nr:hypothetical protein [Nodosilinea sp. P-1105]